MFDVSGPPKDGRRYLQENIPLEIYKRKMVSFFIEELCMTLLN